MHKGDSNKCKMRVLHFTLIRIIFVHSLLIYFLAFFSLYCYLNATMYACN